MSVADRTITREAALRDALRDAATRARIMDRPVVVSVPELVPPVDPLAVFVAGRARGEDCAYWERPDTGRVLVGVGAAYALDAEGARDAAAAARTWRALLAGAVIRTPAWGTGPILLGGFRFDPADASALWRDFPPGRLVLPRHMLARSPDGVRLTTHAVVAPHDDPDALAATMRGERNRLLGRAADVLPAGREDHRIAVRTVVAPRIWRTAVGRTAEAARAGEVEKVVLARAVRAEARDMRGPVPFEAARVLHRLRDEYGHCTVFAVARGESVFLGATPERLISLRGGEVRTSALAGSRPRGATPAEDARFAADLLASRKDRAEHAVVARMLVRALEEMCDAVEVPAEPRLLRLGNVQHLWTPVAARARAGQSVLDLVARLHPTPAVCGAPRAAALELIRELEGLDRGWYAGPVGWVDARGEGEFVVGLRSALLRGGEATLYAGCGIVADSDPEEEYRESELKLRPVLSALGGVRR